MTNGRFDALFGGQPRDPIRTADQRHMDLAASVQAVTEESVLRLTRSLAREGRSRKSVSRGRRRAELRRQRQDPARTAVSRTSGCSPRRAMPAARSAPRSRRIISLPANHARRRRPMRWQAAISGRRLRSRDRAAAGAGGRACSQLSDEALIEQTSRRCRGEGGRLVPGPDGVRPARARRPLDPRRPALAAHAESLNLRVKFRESFRPFAPAVLREDVAEWFELDGDSPYMLIVADVLPKHRRPAMPGDEERCSASKAQHSALGYSGGDPCRLFGADPDRARRHQSALSRAADRLQGARPAVRCWSTPASTSAASRSCARRKTLSAASWAATSRCWWSAIVSEQGRPAAALKLDYKNAFELD